MTTNKQTIAPASDDPNQPQGVQKEQSPSIQLNPEPQPAARPDPEIEMFRNQRISQAVSLVEPGKKLLEIIPGRRPTKEVWVRTHPNTEKYWYTAPVVELKDSNNEVYFLKQDVFESLQSVGEKLVTVRKLALTCSRSQIITFWPLSLPGEDGKFNPWHESAFVAASKARRCWIRITADKALGAYEIHQRPPDKVEPHWPDLPVEQLLKIAFKGRIIDSLDHPVIRELRGESTDKATNATDAIKRIMEEQE